MLFASSITSKEYEANQQREKLINLYDQGYSYRVTVDGKTSLYKTRDGAVKAFRRQEHDIEESIVCSKLKVYRGGIGHGDILQIFWAEMGRRERKQDSLIFGLNY